MFYLIFFTSKIWHWGRWSFWRCCFRTRHCRSDLALSPRCLQGFYSVFNVKFRLDSVTELRAAEVTRFTWRSTDWTQGGDGGGAIPDSLRRKRNWFKLHCRSNYLVNYSVCVAFAANVQRSCSCVFVSCLGRYFCQGSRHRPHWHGPHSDHSAWLCDGPND